MEVGKRRRAVLGTLAAAAVAAGVVVPAGAAFAADYPPSVEPSTVTNDTGNNTEVQGATVEKAASGSLALTGGDIEGLAAIGAGAALVGVVLVRRSRARRA